MIALKKMIKLVEWMVVMFSSSRFEFVRGKCPLTDLLLLVYFHINLILPYKNRDWKMEIRGKKINKKNSMAGRVLKSKTILNPKLIYIN